jgi:hypothetical protein
VLLVPPLAIGRVPVTPVVSGKPVALVNVPLVGVPSIGVTSVGLVARTTEPVPVSAAKSVNPKSQDAAVVPVVRIQVMCIVVPGIIVPIRFAPEELTVMLPVLLLQIWKDQPVDSVEVTGITTVWVSVPVKYW